jgi:hypothetical protein
LNRKRKHTGGVMIYSIIYLGRMRNIRVLLCYTLIVSYMIMYSGCTTTDIEYLNPDTQGSGMLKDITKIKLISGRIINCKDNLISIEKSSDTTGFALIQTSDTVRAGSNGYGYLTSWNELKIPLSDIQNFQIYETKGSGAMSFGIILGSLVLITLLCIAVAGPIFGK